MKQILFRPTDGAPLGILRILFGILMIYEKMYYLSVDLAHHAFSAPDMIFHFDGLSFINPLPEDGMNALLVALAISAVCITLGVLFRPATLFFCIGSTYILLIDRSIFNNHMYVFSLISFLMLFTPADKYYSLRNLFKPANVPEKIPYWQVLILQLVVFIAYFYGGIAKINPDWLFRMEPVTSYLKAYGVESAALSAFIVWGGTLFDLGIVFGLWFRRTRWISFFLVLFFNIFNSVFFDDIGIFPLLMICSTILFFDSKDLGFLRKGEDAPQAPKGKKEKGKPQAAAPAAAKMPFANTSPALVMTGMALFFGFQFLFPLRWMVLPNHPELSGVGNYFAWRMKIQARKVEKLEIYAKDPVKGTELKVPIDTYLNPVQVNFLARDPRALLTMAQYLKGVAKTIGIQDAIINARIKVAYNGYPPRYIVDPNLDLTKVTYDPMKKMDWIRDLRKPQIDDSL